MIPSLGEDSEDARDTVISLTHPTFVYHHGRQRSRSFMDVNQLVGGGKDAIDFSDGSRERMPRRHSASIKLHVSIPPSRSVVGDISSPDDSSTPQSDSPQTPASIISPISGVVDLTKDVMTTSPFAVAHGGLSDIYLGEWHKRDTDTGEIEVVNVSRYILHLRLDSGFF